MKVVRLAAMVCLSVSLCILGSCGGSSGEVKVVSSPSTITFPLQGGAVIGDPTMVCGSSEERVDAVYVNGQLAQSDDGFQTWRLSLGFPAGEHTVSVVSQAQGVEIGRETIQFRNDSAFISSLNRVSREEGGVFVALDRVANRVVRIDRNTGTRQALGFDGTVVGPPSGYAIQRLWFDPNENRAILFDELNGPRIITADFDDGQVSLMPVPVASPVPLKDFDYDAAMNRLFVRSRHPQSGLIDYITAVDLSDMSQTRISDHNSPNAVGKRLLELMAFEPTLGEFYAYTALTNEILRINLQTGSRDVVVDLWTLGIDRSQTWKAMAVAANPLRFLLFPQALDPAQAQAGPLQVIPSQSFAAHLPASTFAGLALDDIVAPASQDQLRLNRGDALDAVSASGTTSTVFALGLPSNSLAGSALEFDRVNRRLLTASPEQLESGRVASPIREPIPDTAAPANQASFGPSDLHRPEVFHDVSLDRILFRDETKLYAIPAVGGTRTEIATVGDQVVGRVVFDAASQTYLYMSLEGSLTPVFTLKRLDLAGEIISVRPTALRQAGRASVAFDLTEQAVYICGALQPGSDAEVYRFDLATSALTQVSIGSQVAPSLAESVEILPPAGQNELLVLVPAGLVSISRTTGHRTVVADFQALLGAQRFFKGLTRDPKSGLLFISALVSATDDLAPGVARVLFAFERSSRSIQVLGR